MASRFFGAVDGPLAAGVVFVIERWRSMDFFKSSFEIGFNNVGLWTELDVWDAWDLDVVDSGRERPALRLLSTVLKPPLLRRAGIDDTAVRLGVS